MKGGDFKRVYVKVRSPEEIKNNAVLFFNSLSEEAKQKHGYTVEKCIASFLMEEERNQDLLVYRNQIYTVHVDENTDLAFEELAGKMCHLSIKRNDKRPCNDWQDFQDIKNLLAGEERQAIQIYPKESMLVDTVNQYHLWVFPEEMVMPLGWFTRWTIDGEIDPKTAPIGQRKRRRK